ncbi:MFS transporter [Streptomyces thinghirensis]|nr:MFS transporter [Streptomyces thinghirensis]
MLIVAGMGLSVLGFQQASAWGWDSAATWACIAGGLALLAFFCHYELRTTRRHPLINLAVFRDRAFTVDALVLFFAMLAFVPVFFFASVYAQVSLSASPNQAALYLLYFFAGFAIASQWGGRILDKRGARPAMRIGCAVGAVGFALWAGKLTDLSMHDQWPYVALAGAGIGFILAPASTDAVNRAIDASYGEVTGITQTVRNYAASVGLAVFGTMLTHTMTDRVTETLARAGTTGRGALRRPRRHASDHGQRGLPRPHRRRRDGDDDAGGDARDPHGLRRGQPVGLLRHGRRPRRRLLLRLRHPGGRAATDEDDAG